jgi:ABC-type Mn2+/Zn2+ transport system permease subunit
MGGIAGVASCVAGLVISCALGIPSGAAIVIVATVLFALAALF